MTTILTRCRQPAPSRITQRPVHTSVFRATSKRLFQGAPTSRRIVAPLDARLSADVFRDVIQSLNARPTLRKNIAANLTIGGNHAFRLSLTAATGRVAPSVSLDTVNGLERPGWCWMTNCPVPTPVASLNSFPGSVSECLKGECDASLALKDRR